MSMNKNWLLPVLIACVAIIGYFNGLFEQSGPAEATEKGIASQNSSFKVDSQPLLQNVERLGINLAIPNTDETGQIFRNILMNPGFEGKIDRLIVMTSQSDKTSFSDDKGWGYPDGYWKGATFEVRSGPYVGLKGNISDSLHEGKDGYPQYFSDITLPTFQPDDVIALTKTFPQDALSFWRISESAQKLVKIDENHRPGSGGSHALLLEPVHHIPLTISSIFDKEAQQNGKLIPVNGNWNFSIWVKAEGENPALTIEFKRKSQVFLAETIHPTSFWKKYSFDFTAHDDGPAKPLALKITGSGDTGIKIWVDDLSLGPIQEESTEFRQEMIQLLKDLRPSFIREQPSIGDTLENRLADPTKRQHWTLHTAGSSGQEMFSYSLNEFLNLCQTVRANPWIIIPTTFSDEEYRQLGQFLALHAPEHLFPKVILEFGKENWNWTFRPTGIPIPSSHGAVADRAFQFILLGANAPTHFIKTINGQYIDPPLSLIYLEKSATADALAISPYFFNSLDAQTSDKEAIKSLFQADRGYVKQIAAGTKSLGKKFSVSEINLHTFEGTASGEQKNRFVAGSIAGTAFAKRILELIKLGADPIMVFNLFQHNSNTWDSQDDVKLSGIVRNVGTHFRYRPTGLAMRMLNTICAGTVYDIGPTTVDINAIHLTALAFTPENAWAAALVSTNESALSLDLTFPDDNKPLPTSMTYIEAASPFDNNEESEKVTLKHLPLKHVNHRTVSLTIPPYGFAILDSQKSLTKILRKELSHAFEMQAIASLDSSEAPQNQKEREFLEHFEEIRKKRIEFEENAP
ncbi:putative uncharacterized protein [Parachlamydia acanthamoebae UV-7]|uniref:CBM-cenC domain-containing protein n=3 Tax=Parachlamydia acanthamoebae TaxID=83552 RepID=F8L2M1_PARAV|nr:hypothetical protein pah_c001o011 [Parachlamydia acanthamoebae str. Hall's coccus]CCB87547.1 putative uncharacterized protein [Parachlamydia acanthamoebae UV-7]